MAKARITKAVIRKKKEIGLPKGLQEFRGSLYEMKYALSLLPRLLDLPENGLSDKVRQHAELCKEAARLEDLAHKARIRAAALADTVFDFALANWSWKEVQQATGYDDE